MKIVAHTIVKNEQNWIWYSLNSVLDYVDEIMVWDTGSTDSTVDIIKSISSPKIKLKQIDNIDPDSYTNARQAMLENTTADWLMILDGDEVWPEDQISQTLKIIHDNCNDVEYLVHHYYNLIGDVYHYQDESAGRYQIQGQRGHLTIRFLNLKKIPGLHFSRPHGQQGLLDASETLVQDRTPFAGLMTDLRYLHMTHMSRSPHDMHVMKRPFKFKYELGHSFTRDFDYPKSFYVPHKRLIPSPWERRNPLYSLIATVQTPLKRLKRTWIASPSGY